MTVSSPPPGFGGPHQPSPQQSPRQFQPDSLKSSTVKRVSFAAGENLCQVRLFAAEDAPVMSGSTQELLQAKPVRSLHMFNSTGRLPGPNAPPGFGGVSVGPKPDFMALAAIVPQLSWRPPGVFNLHPIWHVMAGGSSIEIGLQKQREVRVLEAVYPRPSSIPESPAEPMEVQEPYDDSSTPQIPLVPLEEDDLPDGNEISTTQVGHHGSYGLLSQVTGVQTIPPNAPGISNRSEKVKEYVVEKLAGPIPECAFGRMEMPWRDPSAILSGRSPVMTQLSDPVSGRAHKVGLPPYLYPKPNHSIAEPDVAVAAAAAFAALSKSQEIGSMIDNELLIQILNDPSLIQSLTEQQFTLANLKSKQLATMGLPGTTRGIDKTNQLQIYNRVPTASNHWNCLSSTPYPPVPAVEQEGSRKVNGEDHLNGVEKLQRTVGLDDRSVATLPILMGSCQPNPQVMIGRVLSDIAGRSTPSSDAPPGFGNSSTSVKIMPGLFGSKLVPQQGRQTLISQVGAATVRPLSRNDVQYYKSLILQHGCKSADDDDHGRAGVDKKGKNVAGPPSMCMTPEVKRWVGMEEDGCKTEKYGRDPQETDRKGVVSTFEMVTRTKSRKTCMYYGTSRGCRNGDNCTFVHEMSESTKVEKEAVRVAPAHTQYSKRLKVDG